MELGMSIWGRDFEDEFSDELRGMIGVWPWKSSGVC